MANLLTRFNKQVVGSNTSIYDYLPQITSKGDFKRINDINVIIASWSNILNTQRRTYVFDPDYGSDLYEILFDPVDDTTIDRIKTEVESQLMLYDDRATIDDFEILLNANGNGYTVNITVDYEGEKGKLTVTFDGSTVTTQQGGAA